MRQEIFRFLISAFLYWIIAISSASVLVIPSKIISVAIFLPPILGLIWGPVAAVGTCLGGLLVEIIYNNAFEISHLLGVAVWIFLAGYLPYFLWHNKNFKERSFTLSTKNILKLIVILFVTFAVTSVIRTITASISELETVTGLFGFEKRYDAVAFMFVCFINDFLVAIFFDVILFFVFIGEGYHFYNSEDDTNKEIMTDEEHTTFQAGALCYLIFPLAVVYLDIYQIYGMEQIETWMTFLAECLLPMNMFSILIGYLMLNHQRSIMLNVVFLVALTVFISALVLGIGSSFSMARMANSHADDSLHAMSLVCRERLNHTFFCIRQAVNGMASQAITSIESYERFTTDTDYRRKYFDDLKNMFDSIAAGTEGCISYYMRLDPKIEGTKGGFSVERQEERWEGKLAPFLKREPVDLGLYSPDDIKNVGWFYIPLKSHTATWIEPYVDPVTKTYVISYVAPLYVEDKFIGVIGIDIDFYYIIQELRRMSIYKYEYVYLMNRNNLILYHKDQPQGTLFKPNPDFKEMEIYLTNGMWLGIATPLSEIYRERNHILMHLVAAILIVAMFITFGSIGLVHQMISPLKGMTDAARRISAGDLNVQISYESGNELGILVRSIREMAAKLEVYVYRDKLTGLWNVASYTAKRKELDTQSKLNPDLAYAVILFDVNFLKKLNDNYGHQAGDKLICNAAEVIREVFANSPVYRIGGDEFVAVLETQDYEDRENLIKFFDKKISETSFELAGNIINISVARGVGVYKLGMKFANVVKKADTEMYAHKAAIKAKYGEEVR